MGNQINGVAGVLEVLRQMQANSRHYRNGLPVLADHHDGEFERELAAIRTVEGMALALEKAESLIRGSDAEFYAIDATAKVGLGELLRLNLAAYGGATPAGDGVVAHEKDKVWALSEWLHIERPEAERALWTSDLVRIVRLVMQTTGLPLEQPRTPAGGGGELASIIADIRHSALVDDHEPQQIAFLLSIAIRLASISAPAPSADGVALIAAERKRQITAEGWTPEHDDEHDGGELAQAAACYAAPPLSSLREHQPPMLWPWDECWWKPGDRVRELVKAGALIAAEIDRLQRAAAPMPERP